jgi:hypothetical protein
VLILIAAWRCGRRRRDRRSRPRRLTRRATAHRRDHAGLLQGTARNLVRTSTLDDVRPPIAGTTIAAEPERARAARARRARPPRRHRPVTPVG